MPRHTRAAAFDRAPRSLPARVGNWNELADDPNDPRAIAHRARTLAAAWRPGIADRLTFLEELCRGRNVLDLGCVAHDVERLGGDDWLHARLAAVADRCLGVDILDEGVAAMVAAGYDAVVADLSDGLGDLAARGPFDVIVAGELIEHVGDLDMIFRVAAEGLAADGRLVLTTPNPYAPQRVRAGQLGIVWENVDHVTYLFPSGVAELAERSGLRLTEAMTVEDHGPPAASAWRRLKRLVRGSNWRAAGFAGPAGADHVLVDAGPAGRALRRFTRPRPRFTGETFVYVVTRPDDPVPTPNPDDL